MPDYTTSCQAYNGVGFSAVASMLTPRAYHSAILLPNGKVLVAGGQNNGGALSGCEMYDITVNTWSPAASLATPRDQAKLITVPWASDLIFIIGGGNTTTTEGYVPSMDQWISSYPTLVQHKNAAVTKFGTGEIVVVCGFGSPTSSVRAEVLSPTQAPTMSQLTN